MNESTYAYSAKLLSTIVESKDTEVNILISDVIRNNGPRYFLNNIEHLDLPFDIHLKLQSLRQFVKYLEY